MGTLRHSVSNTEIKRSTDRSTVTERHAARDSAINTEPKIMYSKDVGDFDVRVNDTEKESSFFEQQEITWNTLVGRRTPLHSQSITFDQGLQTDLFDTKREVGYVVRPPPTTETTTEETYETTVTTRMTGPVVHRSYEDDQTMMKSEISEWTRSLGTQNFRTTEQRRSQSPEDVVEESYEVVSTLTKPQESEFLIPSTQPKSILKKSTQQTVETTSSKQLSSEDDSSYCEEWTVTEAKRKQDGQTVKTIIDR